MSAQTVDVLATLHVLRDARNCMASDFRKLGDERAANLAAKQAGEFDEALVAVRALYAERDALRAQQCEWQPIGTAPKGREVLVWREDSGPFIAKLTTPEAVLSDDDLEQMQFPDDFEEWFSDAYGWQEGSEKPTHWQPLPEPPK